MRRTSQNVTAAAMLLASCLFAKTLIAEEFDRVQVVNNVEAMQAQLKIHGTNGRVALTDVFRAISRFNGYDDTELEAVLPAAAVSLDGRAARWSIAAVNRVLQPCVHVAPDGDTLEITVNRESARHWINSRKANLRWAWNQVDWRDEVPSYGIELVSSIHPNDVSDIVVLVHGLNSRPEDVAGFIPLVERAGLIAATFRYPNDQPIDHSSQLLSDELKRIAQEFPHRNVRLLTHSMGGLVARGTVETDLDPGNVSQLIMVAPPNHGSSLARVATFMDCYEFCTSEHCRRAGILVESVSDGLGEANADLAPGSVFLDQLNHLQRNQKIRYTILLGTDGPMTQTEMDELRKTVRECSDGNRCTRFVSSKLNRALAGLDEVVIGKGDGVVSCQRGKLEGVTDIVELPFSHASVLSANAKTSRAAHMAILDRLMQ